MEAFGRGKVILLGEHGVVYGHPALAGALALGVSAVARPAAANRLRVDAWKIDTARDPGGTPAQALAALVSALGPPRPVEVEAVATVPSRAGLGSSAALAVAAARAIAAAFGRTLADDQIEAVANEAERVFHGNPSGVDVALATRGGIGVFEREQGLTPLPVAPFHLAVGLSGVPRDTGARVADVARRRERDRAGTDAALTHLGDLARRGRDALAGGRLVDLGELFDDAHRTLAGLELSSPALDRLCVIARQAGARGAKLTGAGGGGAVIAIGNEIQVARAWRREGFESLVVEVGAR